MVELDHGDGQLRLTTLSLGYGFYDTNPANSTRSIDRFHWVDYKDGASVLEFVVARDALGISVDDVAFDNVSVDNV